jgi:hypothetical protein
LILRLTYFHGQSSLRRLSVRWSTLIPLCSPVGVPVPTVQTGTVHAPSSERRSGWADFQMAHPSGNAGRAFQPAAILYEYCKHNKTKLDGFYFVKPNL